MFVFFYNVSQNSLSKYLNEIKEFYSSRGINLLKTGNKWCFRTAEELKDDKDESASKEFKSESSEYT